MTHMNSKSVGPPHPVIHVGVICGRRMLTSAQRISLRRQLRIIGEEHPGYPLILHHGCGHDGDEMAHLAARALGDWRIHGHPASELSDGGVLLMAGVMRGLNRIYESKPPRQRNVDIVDACEILVIIRTSGQQSELEMVIKRAQAANRTIIDLTGDENVRESATRKAESVAKPCPVVATERTPEWAARQGREDAAAGKSCPRYETFRSTYELKKCDASLGMWHAYHNQAKLAVVSTPESTPKPRQKPKPKRKPVKMVLLTRGLSLIDAPTSHRQTVRRYDRMKPPKSDLSPENAALLMKVNQQNTLVDAWR
jgi:hypothetical protein